MTTDDVLKMNREYFYDQVKEVIIKGTPNFTDNERDILFTVAEHAFEQGRIFGELQGISKGALMVAEHMGALDDK